VPLIEPRHVAAILLDNTIDGISIPALEIDRAQPCGFEAAAHRCLVIVKGRLADAIESHSAKGKEDVIALLGSVGILGTETDVSAAGEEGDDGGENCILDDGDVLTVQKTIDDHFEI
jgi:hypothetical protein